MKKGDNPYMITGCLIDCLVFYLGFLKNIRKGISYPFKTGDFLPGGNKSYSGYNLMSLIPIAVTNLQGSDQYLQAYSSLPTI
jgi:hypothetical protein